MIPSAAAQIQVAEAEAAHAGERAELGEVGGALDGRVPSAFMYRGLSTCRETSRHIAPDAVRWFSQCVR